MESVKCLRKTSDEAALKRGGGMNNAPLALLQKPALTWFQGRLLLPVLALGGLLLVGCQSTHKLPENNKLEEGFPETIRLLPDYAEEQHNVGAACLAEGLTDYAIKAYRENIRRQPDAAWLHNSLGATLLGKGEFVEAITEFREAIRLKPALAEAHYNLGLALGKKGETEEPINAYYEAIRLKPEYAKALEGLAFTLDEEGKRKEAREYWKRSLKSERRPEWVKKIKKRLAEPR
jgi:tetratricopeptide (TPR) repeat protein